MNRMPARRALLQPPAPARRALLRPALVFLIVAAGALACLFLDGCALMPSTAAQAEKAETTRLKITDPRTGRVLEIDFAKELSSKTLGFTLDPSTGYLKLDSTELQTSASQPINAAGTAQANAMTAQAQALQVQSQALTNFLGQALPVIAKAGAAGVSAAVPGSAPVANAIANAIIAPPPAPPVTAPPVALRGASSPGPAK